MIVSGGQGPGESISEAEAMKRYLESKGIDSKRIIEEGKSTDTQENIKFSKEILSGFDKRENIKIMIITSDFHIFRAKYIAKKFGFIPYGIPVETPLPTLPSNYVREFFAVTKTFIEYCLKIPPFANIFN